MCPNNEYPLTQEDFACIGDVARHCDKDKLCIAVGESEIADMEKLYCDVWDEIRVIIDEVIAYQNAVAECELDPECDVFPDEPKNYGEKLNLVCGGSFTGCSGKPYKHSGVIKVWIYYAYSRYIFINGYSDTANGLVTKTSDYTNLITFKEREAFADKYRDIGFDLYKRTLQFLKQSSLVNYKVCGCNHCNGTLSKGWGIKGKTISKYGGM